jgi:PIN domain nuclease of toxin-antitoxin system
LKLLLDTHIILWAAGQPEKLGMLLLTVDASVIQYRESVLPIENK